MTTIRKGAWVEVERVVLAPGDRAPTIPDDTRQTPFVLRVNGFLQADAHLGDNVQVVTLAGRTLSGKLARERPSYTHSFGDTVPELLPIGTQEQP
jgi:hypothetical protein